MNTLQDTKPLRTWTKIAADHTDGRHEELEGMFDRLEWQDIPVESVAMIPGLAIKAAIDQLGIPNVERVAISNEMAPYGLYGIESRYSNGMVRIYLLDFGSVTKTLASDFWPNEVKSEIVLCGGLDAMLDACGPGHAKMLDDATDGDPGELEEQIAKAKGGAV